MDLPTARQSAFAIGCWRPWRGSPAARADRRYHRKHNKTYQKRRSGRGNRRRSLYHGIYRRFSAVSPGKTQPSWEQFFFHAHVRQYKTTAADLPCVSCVQQLKYRSMPPVAASSAHHHRWARIRAGMVRPYETAPSAEMAGRHHPSTAPLRAVAFMRYERRKAGVVMI